MKVQILEISTYNQGRFLVEFFDEQFTCELEYPERDWDKLYYYLMEPMFIHATQIGEYRLLVHSIE